MIISASRRTDIPAFYANWFMNRIREGWCAVPNPFNSKQVSRISLRPEDVDVIVFWTRYSAPLLQFLEELDDRGYRYYFLYTLMNNPRALDPKKPSYQRSLNAFRTLSNRIGKDKVVWRYDPIVFTPITDLGFHGETYHSIAEALKGYTCRCVISIADIYRKAGKRLKSLEAKGLRITEPPEEKFGELMNSICGSAAANGMAVQRCAEPPERAWNGIAPGKCIDDGLIRRVFGLDTTHLKDPSQRPACGCVASRDIGMYDTCRFGCVYCYATTDFDRARDRYLKNDLNAPSLTGRFEDQINNPNGRQTFCEGQAFNP